MTRKYPPTRSFRANDELWAEAKERAGEEGKSMSAVMLLLLEGYARRMIDLPRTRLVFLPPAGGEGD